MQETHPAVRDEQRGGMSPHASSRTGPRYTFDSGRRIRDDCTDVDYDTFYNDLGMPVGTWRWLIMLDGHDAERGERRGMWTQASWPTGTGASSPFQRLWLDRPNEVLGEPVILHSHSVAT